MAEQTAVSITQHTWKPWRGCTKISPGCKNCLHPETLVLRADWTWGKLWDIVPGEKVVGFKESGHGIRKYLEAEVVAVRTTRKPALKVRTRHTEVVTSYDH